MVATLQQLALEQNANLMIDDELEGTLSLQLDNVDFYRLLRSVAKNQRALFFIKKIIFIIWVSLLNMNNMQRKWQNLWQLAEKVCLVKYLL